MDIMQLCRLCLVKDQVNIPIFGEQGDIRQIFLKITACLPVKVSKEDNLPKKICDGCLYKLELLYQFWNTTVNAEKQLLEWLNQAGLDANKKATDGAMAVVNDVQDAADLVLKEEAIDITEVRGDEEDDLSTEANSYILQQQQLPYQTFEYQQDGTKPSDDSIAAAAEETTQPPAKRQKVSAAPAQTIVNPETESDDDIDTTEMKLTKVEDDSDGENPEPTTFVGVDNEQPGPSGVGKTAEAPICEIVEASNNHHGCHICGKHYDSATKLVTHRRRTHPKTLLECPECGKMIKSKQSLLLHIEVVHKKHEVQRCEFCDRTFKNMFTYKVHEKKYHTPNVVKYYCQDCDKSYFVKSELEQHCNSAHKGILLKCEICSESFSSKGTLNRHKVLHGTEEDKKKFRCPHCPTGYPFKNLLRRHIKFAHDKAKDFLCTTCGKRFPCTVQFKEHTNIHLGIKPHVCEVCGKSFSSRTGHRSHIVVHTKEKPLKCKYCDKGFSQHSSLKIHVKTVHEKELPHGCSVCDKKFVFKAQLNTHMKTHGVFDNATTNKITSI